MNSKAIWRADIIDPMCHSFHVYYHDKKVAEVNWDLMGDFNVENALAAIAATVRAGVSPLAAGKALEQFIPVKRRLELKYYQHDIAIYDDFAHHPTAIQKTIQALKQSKKTPTYSSRARVCFIYHAKWCSCKRNAWCFNRC